MNARPSYLLDTNILSDLIRNPQGQIAIKIAEVGEKNICTSIIVASELRFGVEKKQSPRLTEQVEIILSAINILPLEEGVDRYYGKIRADLENTGRIIGPNDLLIAAHCLSNDNILVTANVNEFKRIASLRVENWLANL